MYNYTSNTDNTYPSYYTSESNYGQTTGTYQPTQDQFVERSREVVHELSRPENHENNRKAYKGARNFRGDDDLFLPSYQETIPQTHCEEAVKSSHYYQPSEEPQFVERTREFNYEVSREDGDENSQKTSKAGRDYSGSEDLASKFQELSCGRQIEGQNSEPQFVERTREFNYEISRDDTDENSQKTSKVGRDFSGSDELRSYDTYYGNYGEVKPYSEEPQFVERSREIDFEVTRPDNYEHIQKAKKGARNIRDEDDLLPSCQETVFSNQQEEAPKASYYTSEEPQFVERSREVTHELSRPENHENNRKAYKGARNFRGDDDLFLPSNQETIPQTHCEEAVKSSHYYQPSEEPQFVERTREFNYEVSREDGDENSQKTSKATRDFGDSEDLYLSNQPTEEPQFVERTREFNFEVSRSEEDGQKTSKATRDLADAEDLVE